MCEWLCVAWEDVGGVKQHHCVLSIDYPTDKISASIYFKLRIVDSGIRVAHGKCEDTGGFLRVDEPVQTWRKTKKTPTLTRGG